MKKMKSIISMLLVVLSFYSCSDSFGDDNVQNCGDITNVAYESFDYCGKLKENPTRPVYVVIKSISEMNEKFTSCETYNTVLPDFTQKRILGLFSGPKPTGGYSIKIESVIQDDCQILVRYFETAPGENDAVATVITYPADYVVLPISNKPILFSKVNKIVDYVILGTYIGRTASSQCDGECNSFYQIESQKVVQYLKVNNFPAEFNQNNYKSLAYKEDFIGFTAKIPTQMLMIKEVFI
jgi:hypothetical protein